MSKIRKISETSLSINFNSPDQNFTRYWDAFLKSNLGSIYVSIPWQNLIKDLKIKDKERGRDSIFSARGKLALMFLKNYTGLSDKKLLEQINANYEYQFFCDIEISPENKLNNFKIISDIRVDIASKLDLRSAQMVLSQAWKPYMNYTNAILEDATCYETSMRYPTDVKLLWESTGWIYGEIKRINKIVKGRMPRSKFSDQKDKYLSYSKGRKKSYKKTHRRKKSLLYLLEKLLNQLSDIQEKLPNNYTMPDKFYTRVKIIETVLEQQTELFSGNNVKNRIVSISKSYIRPIKRGKETKSTEFGAKANIVQIDKIDFIEHISFNAFNEGTRLKSSVYFAQDLFNTKIHFLGADAIYATNKNRIFCKANKIVTGFVRKGRAGKHEDNLKKVRKVINIKRATEMEGAFGKHKNHYSLNRIKARTKETELLWIFFGIHTANAVEIGKRIKQSENRVKKRA